MTIPDEAVEAAARGLARHKWPTAIGVWESFGQGMQDDFRDQARAALEAAAPYLRAQSLEEAADDPILRLAGHSGISITRLRARAAEMRVTKNA